MKIEDYGFGEVGKWELNESLKSRITFKLYRYENDRVIYAFVTDDSVKRIGVCDVSTTTLKDRMKRYQGWMGQGANKKVALEIKKCLEEGKGVRIFALKPETPCLYKGLNIDLVKGLEYPLIERLQPEWNIHK